MRKIIICALGVMFAASIFLFSFYGGDLRDVFSPKVVCVSPEYVRHNDMMHFQIMKSAVIRDGDETFVYVVEPSDKYAEEAYQIVRVNVEIVDEIESDCVIVSINNKLSSGRYIAEPSDKLKDGMRVCLVKRN